MIAIIMQRQSGAERLQKRDQAMKIKIARVSKNMGEEDKCLRFLISA